MLTSSHDFRRERRLGWSLTDPPSPSSPPTSLEKDRRRSPPFTCCAFCTLAVSVALPRPWFCSEEAGSADLGWRGRSKYLHTQRVDTSMRWELVGGESTEEGRRRRPYYQCLLLNLLVFKLKIIFKCVIYFEAFSFLRCLNPKCRSKQYCPKSALRLECRSQEPMRFTELLKLLQIDRNII